MTKKFFSLLLVAVLGLTNLAKADEGMWLPMLIGKNYEQMKKQGFKLTPEDLYNINKASLKDAIVSFGGFCTGEVISNEGLLLTNHHCGYGAIQYNSTPERDLLANGFVAGSFEEELPADPNARIYVTQEITDVTGRIAKVTEGKSGREYIDARNAEVSRIEDECVAGDASGPRLRSLGDCRPQGQRRVRP